MNGFGQLIYNMTEDDISSLKQHLELFLEQIKGKEPTSVKNIETSVSLNDSQSSFDRKLLDKAEATICEREQLLNCKKQLIYENEELKKKVHDLQNSLTKIHQFQEDSDVFDMTFQEKQNNQNIKLQKSLSNSNTPTRLKSSWCEERDELRKMFLAHERQVQAYSSKIKQLETDIYCLNYEQKMLEKQIVDLRNNNSLLARDLEVKSNDYEYLKQKVESLTQQLNFFYLPERLETEEIQQGQVSLSKQFIVPKIMGLRQNGDDRAQFNGSFRSRSICQTDRKSKASECYEKIPLSKQLAPYQDSCSCREGSIWRHDKDQSPRVESSCDIQIATFTERCKPTKRNIMMPLTLMTDCSTNTQLRLFNQTRDLVENFSQTERLDQSKSKLRVQPTRCWYLRANRYIRELVRTRIQKKKTNCWGLAMRTCLM